MVSHMLVLAHRGANRLAPENTLPAMVAALDLGADGVELDVHRSADGDLVVRHDADTPLGALGALSVAQIRAGLPEVPTLAEVLDAGRGRLVNVEVKDPDPRAVDVLVGLLQHRGGDDDVLVSSFHLPTIDLVRAADPTVATALLTVGLDPFVGLVQAGAHGHRALHPDVATLLRADVAALVDRAHDQGLEVNVWTVNDREQVLALRDGGVDGIITDDAELYRFGLRGRGLEPRG
jgi:glycerophosphoryl diester phosphodiesterase